MARDHAASGVRLDEVKRARVGTDPEAHQRVRRQGRSVVGIPVGDREKRLIAGGDNQESVVRLRARRTDRVSPSARGLGRRK